MSRNKETQRRAAAVVAWLEAHPQGGNARDIHAGLQHTRGFSTTQKLLIWMLSNVYPGMVTLGAGAHTRYAAPRHKATAQAHMDATRRERNAKWAREVEARRERMMRLASGEQLSDDVMTQRVVREWAKPKVTAPRSVFELAGA